MEIVCKHCGEITENDNAIFCKYCGFRLGGTELDVLKNIEVILKEGQMKQDNSSRTQIKISYASLIISMIAYIVALVALLLFVFNQPIEQRIVGITIIVFLLITLALFLKKYNVAPVSVDEIER